MSDKERKVKVHSFKPGVLKKSWYKVIPYDIVAEDLKRGREVLVEGISRQLARYAAQKLSKMVREDVGYCRAEFEARNGTIVTGYAFFLKRFEASCKQVAREG